MAIFQDNEHHADETVRRAFTPADRNFLLNLQTELNTQSNMGNADPSAAIGSRLPARGKP